MLKQVLEDKNYSIRTQISLSPTLKRLIDVKRKIWGESLAEYLRKAAVMRFAAEEAVEEEIKRVIKLTKGCIPKGKYLGLDRLAKIVKWQRKERASWNRRGS